MRKTLTTSTLIGCLMLLLSHMSSYAQHLHHHRIQAFVTEEKFREAMQAGMDIDHFHFRDGILVAEVSDHDIQILKAQKIKFKYLVKDLEHNLHKHNAKVDKLAAKDKTSRAITVPTPVNFGTGGTYGASGAVARHFTFAELEAELDQMRALYPNLISAKTSLGTSIEGRNVYMIRFSDNPDVDENEPEVLMNALHHAREPISLTQLIFFMWHMLENYATDKEIQQLMNSTELYILPCLNPDGYVYNQTTNPTGGGMWRKNRRLNSGGSYGVDLNRNWSYGWGGTGSSSTQSNDTYRGTAAFSEPETQTIRNFCNSRQFVTGFNFHSYGNYCLYPWSNVAANNNPEIPLFNQLSIFLTSDNSFTYGNANATVGYVASGVAEDWAYAEQTTKPKFYSFTPEIGTSTDGFWPAASRIIPLCNTMIVMNKNLMKVSSNYAEVTPSLAANTTSLNSNVPFSIKSFCINASTYTVTLNPLNSFVTSVGAPDVVSGMTFQQTLNRSISFSLDPGTPANTSIQFEITLNNGHYVRRDTISTQFVCPAPTGGSTTAITTTSANASWNALAGATDYYVAIKTAASSTWGADVLVSGSTTYSFTGLNPFTAYNWRVREANCGSYGATQNFTTLDNCGTPNPTATSITSSSFTITWAAINQATSYEVNYRQSGSGTWNTASTSSTSFALSGLAPVTVYEFQVKATCLSGPGVFSAIGTATTSSSTVTYCASNGTNNTLEWIDFVNLGSISRTSGAETGGYINTGLTTNLVRGNSVTMTYSAGFASTIYRQYWRVFIDYNQDGDFTDAGESVFYVQRNGSGNFSNTFTVPSTALLGTTRMRVKMNYNSFSNPCGSYTYGEVEDYTINITATAAREAEAIVTGSELKADVLPNPFNEFIQVSLLEDNQTQTHIALTDLSGKVIYETSLDNNVMQHQIPAQHLSTGLYLLTIEQGDKKKVIKLVK